MRRPLLLTLAVVLIAAGAVAFAVILLPEDEADEAVPCPVETYICERAGEFAQNLLVEQDFDWIVANYDGISFVVCNDTSGLFPNVDPALCQGTVSEEERMVYEVSEGDAKRICSCPMRSQRGSGAGCNRQRPPRSDGYGDGQPRLYTIGCTLYSGAPDL